MHDFAKPPRLPPSIPRPGFVGALVLAAAALAALLIATALHHPLLLPIRDHLLPGLLLAGLAGAAATAPFCRHPAMASRRRAIVLLWLATPGTALAIEAGFRAERAAVLRAAGSAEAALLAPHFIVGHAVSGELAHLAAFGLVGGIYVTRRNVAGRPAAAFAAEIAARQEARDAAGLPPLIVAADQEGGGVSHLSPPLPRLPALATAAALPPAERERAAAALGRQHGSGLAALGVTMNLAPLGDLRLAGPSALDLYSRIAERAIAADPETVATVALAYGRALRAEGVTPVLKHFPGLGRVSGDTHLSGARLAAPTDELAATDWLPFRRWTDAAAGAVMVGHVRLAAVDPYRPASLSRAVVTGLLRDAWRFDGVVITDDLTMAAVHGRGLCRSVVEALNAGVDLLLISYDGDRYYRAMRCAVQALRRGRIDRAALGRSAARLDANRRR